MKGEIIALLAVGGLLAAAGCSSSSPSGGGGSGPGSANHLPGPSFVLGAIGSYSGAQSSSIGLVDDTSKVWAKWINDNGGINGHPVKLIVKDDALDPGKALQAAKELVEQDHVQAIVGEHSQIDNVWAKYVQDKGIPVIGGNPTQPSMFTYPNFFPTGASTPANLMALIVQMKENNLKKLGMVYCAEAPVCATLGTLATAISTVVGDVSVAYTGKIAATQPSFTSECLAAKSAGADAFFTADSAPLGPKVASDCQKVGYNPHIVAETTTTSSLWTSAPSVSGALLTAPNANYSDTSVPGIKDFHDAIEKYQPDMLKSPQVGGNDLWAWAGGQLFATAAKNAHLTPSSTPAQIMAAMYTVKDETLNGISPPLTFTKGKPTNITCYFTAKINDGKFESLNDGKPSCLSADLVAGLDKILGG